MWAHLQFSGSTLTPLQFFITRNVYQYSSRYLILSYAAAIVAASIATGIGFYSFSHNGASHSLNFSVLMSTTRNPELDARCQRLEGGLDADPLNEELGKVRLRLDSITGGTFRNSVSGSNGHAVFVLEPETAR